MGSPRRAIGFVAAVALVPPSASAADEWVARPLTLPTLGYSADVGLGIGQTTLIEPFPKYDTPVGTKKPGTGVSIDAALGLPKGFELGVALGLRFAASGALTTADGYGRLFDSLPLHMDPGASWFANPEFRITESLFDATVAAGGFEVRFVPGFADTTANILVPGIPLRFRVPHVLRIDAELSFPVAFVNQNTWGVDVPVAVWFQEGQFFFGPVTGVFWNNPASGFDSGGVPSEVDIHAGVGGGVTIAGMFDVKAQLLTTRVNDSSWPSYVGGGLGVGLVMP